MAPDFDVEAPPGGISWVIGSGKTTEGHVAPQSPYNAQVRERLGEAALDRLATPEQRAQLGTYRWATERLEEAEPRR